MLTLWKIATASIYVYTIKENILFVQLMHWLWNDGMNAAFHLITSPYLDSKSTKTLAHSFVTSRVDSNNCSLLGLSDTHSKATSATKWCCPAHHEITQAILYHSHITGPTLIAHRTAYEIQSSSKCVQIPTWYATSVSQRTLGKDTESVLLPALQSPKHVGCPKISNCQI